MLSLANRSAFYSLQQVMSAFRWSLLLSLLLSLLVLRPIKAIDEDQNDAEVVDGKIILGFKEGSTKVHAFLLAKEDKKLSFVVFRPSSVGVKGTNSLKAELCYANCLECLTMEWKAEHFKLYKGSEVFESVQAHESAKVELSESADISSKYYSDNEKKTAHRSITKICPVKSIAIEGYELPYLLNLSMSVEDPSVASGFRIEFDGSDYKSFVPSTTESTTESHSSPTQMPPTSTEKMNTVPLGPSNSSNMPIWVIIVVAVILVLLIVSVVFFIWCFCCRKPRDKTLRSPDDRSKQKSIVQSKKGVPAGVKAPSAPRIPEVAVYDETAPAPMALMDLKDKKDVALVAKDKKEKKGNDPEKIKKGLHQLIARRDASRAAKQNTPVFSEDPQEVELRHQARRNQYESIEALEVQTSQLSKPGEVSDSLAVPPTVLPKSEKMVTDKTQMSNESVDKTHQPTQGSEGQLKESVSDAGQV